MAKTNPPPPWQYHGDISIRHGGYFTNLSDFANHGYAPVVEVTDMDGAAGFTAGIMISQKTINIPYKIRDVISALDCCGYELEGYTSTSDETNTDLLFETGAIRTCMMDEQPIPLATEHGQILLLESINAYMGGEETAFTVFVIGPDADMESRDGWTADERLRSNVNLRKYVINHYL